MRLIDAEDFQKRIENRISIFAKEQLSEEREIGLVIGVLLGIEDLLKIQPTIEAKPIVHAHWVTDFDFDPEEEQELYFYFCSKCKNELFGDKEDFNYCPYCGARMDEVVSDTNVGSKKENDND